MRIYFEKVVHQYQDPKLNLENDKFFSTTLALCFLNHRDFLTVLKMGCNVILHPPYFHVETTEQPP